MRLFVEGTHRQVARALAAAARARGWEVVATAPPGWTVEGAAPLDYRDATALDAALTGCDALFIEAIPLTARERDAPALGVDRALLLAEAGARVGVRRYILLSRRGVEWLPGTLPQARRVAEAIAAESGLAWTLLRPAGIAPGIAIPRFAASLRPLPPEAVALATVHVLAANACRNAILTGSAVARWAAGPP